MLKTPLLLPRCEHAPHQVAFLPSISPHNITTSRCERQRNHLLTSRKQKPPPSPQMTTTTTTTTSFNRFYETWFEQLQHLTTQLTHLPKRPQTPEDHHHCRHLVDTVLTHYAEFHRVNSLAAESDVLSLFSAPWCSSLERSLHWVAGFRPTTIFHLVYTESSIRFESHVVNILQGQRTGDLGELSPSQLGRVSDLQCETVKQENEISEELTKWQDGLVSVEWDGFCADGGGGGGGVEGRLMRLREVVERADNLRMETLRRVVELLTPQQAVEFLTAVAELQFGLRSWGLTLDSQRKGA